MREEEEFDNLRTSSEIISTPVKTQQFGKLHVFVNKPFMHVSLGPNYGDFMTGFGMLMLVSICLTIFIHHAIQSPMHHKIALAFAIVTPILYLMTAFSNPGVYNPSSDESTKNRYCHTCQHYMTNKVRHCVKCGVCIENYDHHCPFMSKCVGRGNIIQFYLFMVSLSLYSIFLYYSIYVGLIVPNWK